VTSRLLWLIVVFGRRPRGTIWCSIRRQDPGRPKNSIPTLTTLRAKAAGTPPTLIPLLPDPTRLHLSVYRATPAPARVLLTITLLSVHPAPATTAPEVTTALTAPPLREGCPMAPHTATIRTACRLPALIS